MADTLAELLDKARSGNNIIHDLNQSLASVDETIQFRGGIDIGRIYLDRGSKASTSKTFWTTDAEEIGKIQKSLIKALINQHQAKLDLIISEISKFKGTTVE